MKYIVLILRYIKGNVRIEIKEGFFERFINLCALKNIKLHDIERHKKKIYATVTVSGYKRIREPARKSGVKVALISKSGLVFDYRKNKNRIALIYGLIFIFVFHIFMNQFVWSIDVTGNSNISSDEIISKAESQGLTYSTYIRGFNEIKAARNIAKEYDGSVTWLSINIKGSLAVIELRESSDEITTSESTSPCNIVAAFDGVILSTEVYSGDLMTFVGNGVRKGDLLISGAIINEDTSTTFYHADGKITAIHNIQTENRLDFTESLYKLSTKDKNHYLNLFGTDFPYKTSDIGLYFTDKQRLKINGYRLPAEYSVKYIAEAEEKADEKLIKIKQYEDIMYNIYDSQKNSTVLSKEEEFKNDGEGVSFIGTYTLIDFIGEEKPILSRELK